MRQYWPIGNKLEMIDDITMNGKRIIIPFSITEADTAAAAQQPHKNRKDKATSVWNQYTGKTLMWI